MVQFYLMVDFKALSLKEGYIFIERCQTHILCLTCSCEGYGGGACAGKDSNSNSDDEETRGRRGGWKLLRGNAGLLAFAHSDLLCKTSLPPTVDANSPSVTVDRTLLPGSLP